MFTGIIESMGRVREVIPNGKNKTYWIESPLAAQLKVDQSIAHNGVCLTVEETTNLKYRVTAVGETLKKTALNEWAAGMRVNLERSLLPSSRLDGHFVQGHVDATGTCRKIKDCKGSWEITFDFPKKHAALVIEKGSICVNGISLTAFNVKGDRFTVAVIPYTWQHTNLQYLKVGEAVNLEFDLLGKYLMRQKEVKR
jgi:riboflavin synthase